MNIAHDQLISQENKTLFYLCFDFDLYFHTMAASTVIETNLILNAK